ncbi:hypothetical protein [Streptomyces coeruleorubidus]|uniref:Uncharacterized protein n=1 Tax=Streptomyces coeruleorubidus TaxID=116188 RepID=A0A5J6I004_STRC4|nr:hypothetical protein [Streptomyces coeruleorubidus]QEV25816.1 hypothetical protein CP976_17765 [Streptomyces coeruleorubidus]GGT93714.1 hypothetical protein GCM10010256_62400 [Streptomyces coeruleorubidus]
MPLFSRAEWPRDHRDELVAGALVGAVVIVLGYASGIGAPSASGGTQTAAPPTSPPAATAPANPAPDAPGDPGVSDPGAGAGQVPIGGGPLPGYGAIGAGPGYGTGGAGGSGHTGHTASPPSDPGAGSPSPSPTPTPSGSAPADGDTCEDGEVTLVQPLLGGLTEPVFGLLDGTGETPTPQPSPCVGLAPVGSLLGGIASPGPEATP